MAFFYFDESIHNTAGFILGAWVAGRTDPTNRIRDALIRAGLRPGIDEYRSGARMQGNMAMANAREELCEVAQHCGIGVVILPSDRRQDVGLEAIRGLQKILLTSGLEMSGHSIFLDEGLVQAPRRFDALVADLGLSRETIHIEQNSVTVLGLQLADLVAHMCATMLLAQMGIVTKQIKAGENSGYDPNDEVDLAFMLWARLRYNFISAPAPAPHEWQSQLDWQMDFESRGLFIASTCSENLTDAALERFGNIYLGCIH